MSALLDMGSLSLEWRDDAACAGKPPAMFHPDGILSAREIAKNYCAECPVRDDCYQYALDADLSDGIWGGFWFKSRNPICVMKLDLRGYLNELNEQGFMYKDMAKICRVSRTSLLNFKDGKPNKLNKHERNRLKRLTIRDCPDPIWSGDHEALREQIQDLYMHGFNWADMCVIAGIPHNLLQRFRDGQRIRASQAEALAALTIHDRPITPPQQRETEAKIAGRAKHLAKIQARMSEARKAGIICVGCGAHVCPIDPRSRGNRTKKNNSSKRVTCGQGICVSRARGRKHIKESA